MQTTVVDRAMQTFGAMGISQIRLYLICGLKGVPYDMQMAPDEVHIRKISRMEINKSKKNPAQTLIFFTQISGKNKTNLNFIKLTLDFAQ